MTKKKETKKQVTKRKLPNSHIEEDLAEKKLKQQMKQWNINKELIKQFINTAEWFDSDIKVKEITYDLSNYKEKIFSFQVVLEKDGNCLELDVLNQLNKKFRTELKSVFGYIYLGFISVNYDLQEITLEIFDIELKEDT